MSIIQPHIYNANGKLLLTAEYLVLDGAKALAVPTLFGQNLIFEPENSKILVWNALDRDKKWFNVSFNLEDLHILNTTNWDTAIKLKHIFEKIKEISPDFNFEGGKYLTNTNFNRNWGLGTSSTLTYNLAQLAKINAMELHQAISNGSGYDVACAGAKNAIFFTKNNMQTHWEETNFIPEYQQNILFVYLNRKQKSDKSVTNYQAKGKQSNSAIQDINQITTEFSLAKSEKDAAYLMHEHEQIIASILDKSPIQQEYFSKFDGQIKSLGAWGGDFVMAISKNGQEYMNRFFSQKGFETQLEYKQMVLNTSK